MKTRLQRHFANATLAIELSTLSAVVLFMISATLSLPAGGIA